MVPFGAESMESSPTVVGDDYTGAGSGTVVPRDSPNPSGHRRPSLERVLDEARERDCVPFDLVRESLSLSSRIRDRERHLEQDEDKHRHAQVAREKASLHGCGASRSPTPRTVSIQRGSPSFFRTDAT